jgi:transcription-repair coupling factor (superfamily II helicase)
MVFSSVIKTLSRNTLTQELNTKLKQSKALELSGISRLAKVLLSSVLAQSQEQNILIVCATLEEAGRWTAQMEVMGWQNVYFYPTSESSPYDLLNSESEMVWGQMQVLSSLNESKPRAIIATERALQPHLPPPSAFYDACITLKVGQILEIKDLQQQLTSLGYRSSSLVEAEGQWSCRGNIVDIFPVSAEIPIRLEYFGDNIEQIKEFDPVSQRSLDRLQDVLLTPVDFLALIKQHLKNQYLEFLSPLEQENLLENNYPEGFSRFLGLAFDQVANLCDYLKETIVVFDELDQSQAHSQRWLDHVSSQWNNLNHPFPVLHCSLDKTLKTIQENFLVLYLWEIAETQTKLSNIQRLNLSSRPLPTVPHQFAKIAEILRGKREIYGGMSLEKYNKWFISSQPSRSVSLLQEHDCPANFIPNNHDYLAIEKLQTQGSTVALKYSGLAELEGFILPPFRLVVVTDREFFGKHSLVSAGYIRKRRRAASKQVDLNKLSTGDYVVHRHHGIGKFIRLENLEQREYLVIQYADGLLRVPADRFDSLTRYRQIGSKPPELHRMSGKTWENIKLKVRKSVKKLAVDLLNIYAKRAKVEGYACPKDNIWQQELEDAFTYSPTPDQLKAISEVKRDLESDRPMDRLVCGDVGFGKTEVAVRAIFKMVTSGHKQVAFLAPTTILTQQHYHTLQERFAAYPIQIGLLNRFRTTSEKKDILQRLATGELDIVIGTQQLLSNSVKFKDLGLLVIDEEQRFGVNQKEKIKGMKALVDVLTLTATPIPRTLYMSLGGIREISLINTPPPSRRPINTHLSPYNPEAIRTAIRNELDRGGQVFYIVPRVEGIEKISSALNEMIPNVRIMIAHGQLEDSELETTMLSFSNGEADLLLCTTIVESGLDIPRVNTIIIEDAQRFGLAQLYQLRGRVGRSGIQAHAWLFYPSKGELTDTARARLRAIQEFAQLGSGYLLATRDMEIRGVGNILGAEQSGQMEIIGFELYMEMLQEALKEIQGQEIPKVEDTQIDLKLTAFIPSEYISDAEQKLTAYRTVATANTIEELRQIQLDWYDRYGKLPSPVEQLFQIIELKQIAKSLGFSRIRPENSGHIVLETPMEEPAWKLLQENLPQNLQSRFVYSPKKVTCRGLALLKPQKQLESLLEWLNKMKINK